MITIVTSSVTPIVSLPGSEAGTDVDVEVVVVVGTVTSDRVVGGSLASSGGAVVGVVVLGVVGASDGMDVVTGAVA